MNIQKKINGDKLLSITKYITETFHVVQSVKLQKILYFLYLDFLREKNRELFPDFFEAWVYGPVLPKVFLHIKNFGFNFSEIERYEYIEEIRTLTNEEIKSFINKEIPKYLELSSVTLIEKTHESDPWKNARSNFKFNKISNKKIAKSDLKNFVLTHSTNW